MNHDTYGDSSSRTRLQSQVALGDDGDLNRSRAFLPRNLICPIAPTDATAVSVVGNGPGMPPLHLHWTLRDANTRGLGCRTKVCTEPFGCVLCSVETGTIESLWKHCIRRHKDYEVELIRTTDGRIHLLLKVCNTSPRDRPKESCSELIYWQHFGTPRKHARRRKKMLVSARTKQDFPLPNRQYYHSTGFQPMSEAAWLLDLDSDDELCDSEWALPITDAEIDDHLDVTSSQKQFMKIWNGFMARVARITVPPLKQLPDICLQFVQEYAPLLHKEKDLEDELICHLANLVEEQHIGRIHLTELMTLYNNIVDQL